ncbi:MAG: DUF4398 domain-containing protein [Spirochaetes bacterium]|nr:MAG: DUF4398 domain-containing protein [Spirochaetota bacterium]
MKMRKQSLLIMACCVALALAVACGDPIPIKEMSLAKSMMTQAQSVKADKYAPKELEDAGKLLLDCHSAILDEKWDLSKDLAGKSYEKAKEAFDKSIPLLAKDAMDIAEKSLKEAEEAYAEELAKAEYGQAKDAMKGSSDGFENKKFYEAYEKALEADKLAKNARNAALGKQDTLRDAIREVEVTLDEAAKLNAAEFAPEKMKAAEESKKLAEEALVGTKLKQGFDAVGIAKVSADEAYLEALKGSSREAIVSAEMSLEKAEKSAGALTAKEELAASKEAVGKAKEQFADARYKESLTSSAEAKRLAAIVIGGKAAGGAVIVGAGGATKTGVEGVAAYPVGSTVVGANGEYIVTGEFTPYKVLLNEADRECLWKISQKNYGDWKLWRVIYSANTDQIKNWDLIYPNQVLRLPVLKKVEKK